MKQQAKSIRSCSNPPADLTGMRYGTWTVLEYAGQKVYCSPAGKKASSRMWLCRCDCGVQKEVPHYNLTKGLSKKCWQCCRTRHGMSTTKLYERWRKLRQSGELPKEWQDFDAFRKAVGDPPDKKAHLTRFDRTKPYSSQNIFWVYPALLQNDPTLLKRLRKKLREESIAHDKTLMRIRKAKSMNERNRFMIAARKAGYSLDMIGMAAKLTRQRVHVIVTTGCR